ncbi:MAG: MauE/DoxX family redox-associated membrane protein [Candidatus Eisenbacteria bacterium]
MESAPFGGRRLAMAFGERTRARLALVGIPVRFYLGAVFVLASLYKIREPYDFALNIATYQILPLELVNPMAIMLPWLELVTGLLFIAGFWTKENALLILGMMLMFVIALVIALSRGYEMTCGCFASREAAEEISARTLVRDFFWIALAGYALLFDDGRYGLDRFLGRRRRNA